MEQIREIVIEEIKKITGLKKVTYDMNLYDELKMSSLETYELLVDLEERFGIEIDEESLGDISTVEEIVEAIKEIVDEK